MTKLISKSGKALATRHTFTKIKKSLPTDHTRKPRVGRQQANNFLSSALLPKTFDKYFVNIVRKLILLNLLFLTNNDLKTGNLTAIIQKYKNHSIIIVIEKYMKGLA